ncbi:MAG: periplasmic heavy metal sensor [Acidobacteria bacterium]|nr:periplasmic heavy metal sensor [Acidobacteriota bacterium]
MEGLEMKYLQNIRFGIMAFAILTAIVAGASAQWGPRGAMGGPGGPGGGPGFGGPGLPLRELNLSDEQKSRIKAIQEKAQEEGEATRDQLRQFAEQRAAIVNADSFNAEAARDLATREASFNIDLGVRRMETENAIYNVLTAEQKAKLTELRNNRPAGGPPMGRRP